MRAFVLFFMLGWALPLAAFAQDDEDDNPFDDALEDDEEDLERGDPEKPNPQPEPDFDEPEDDPDLNEPSDDPDSEQPDLLGDDPLADPNLGKDTADLYRQTLDSVAGYPADEEMQTWDAYLAQYPNTAFRLQIERRVEELENSLYNTAPVRPKPTGETGDADEQQFRFSQGLLIENINPRRRVQVAIEWGLPDYASLGLDYEHAFARNFSVHGGVRRRFTGVNFEGGVRWALVKSARTETLVTFIGDVHLNASPAFVGFRPQLAVGKRLGKLDLQGQAGIDVSPRQTLDLKIVGGLNATYRASLAVAAFFETSVFMGSKSGEFGLYRFNQLSFGMKFFPRQKAKHPENTEVNIGATVPYSSAYWQYHFGSINGQANFYLD